VIAYLGGWRAVDDDALVVVGVEITPLEDSDEREVAELGGRLRSDLRQTSATRVEAVSVGSAPVGSKGFEVLALGHFVVELARSAPALRKVVAVLRDYVARQPVRSVKISLDGDVLEVTAVSSEDQRRLIDAWIAQHAQPGQQQ
jgi:hypothetical protein